MNQKDLLKFLENIQTTRKFRKRKKLQHLYDQLEALVIGKLSIITRKNDNTRNR